MNKIMVDTSVWIDALNGKKNKVTQIFSQFIRDDISIVLCPIVIQEVLQGIRDDKSYKEVKENLSGFEVLKTDPVEAAFGAANLYREIRKKGITIRKSNDCLIAFYCILHKVTLLHKDNDFELIARHSNLRIY